MNIGELFSDYPIYGYKTYLNGDIAFNNIDKVELEIKREMNESDTNDYIKNNRKINEEVKIINDMVIPQNTQPNIGAGRKSFFKIKSKYRSKYV